MMGLSCGTVGGVAVLARAIRGYSLLVTFTIILATSIAVGIGIGIYCFAASVASC
jgi:hypothetical protein